MRRVLRGIVFILTIGVCSVQAQTNFGSNCTPNPECYDSNYPEMEKFASAGVTGGIPEITKIKAILYPGDNIQSAIEAGGEGVVLLTNGTYPVNNSILLKSGVVLRGESREGVKLSVTMKTGKVVQFSSDIKMAGLENLRLVYEALPEDPPVYRSGMDDGWYCSECFANDFPEYDATLIRIDGNDNWVDNVEALKSGSNPVQIFGKHNTFRNSLVQDCYNKGGTGAGYFDLRGESNLVTGCNVRLIRHFAIQQSAKYNVVINNTIEVDVNFHNKDNGYNLVEGNSITRPSWHSWNIFATGGAEYGHAAPGPNNILVNNTTYDYKDKKSKWGETDVIYTFTDFGEPEATEWKMPACGTFYAVNCEEKTSSASPLNFTLPTNYQLYGVGSNVEIELTAADSIFNPSVVLYLNDRIVGEITTAPFKWGTETDTVFNNMKAGIYNIKAVASDDAGNTYEKSIAIRVGDLVFEITEIILPSSSMSLNVGDVFELTPRFSPEFVNDSSLNWSSDNLSVATVIQGGVITALTEGEANITVSAVVGSASSAIKLNVFAENSVIEYTETFTSLTLDGWGKETYNGDNGFEWSVNAKGTSGSVSGSKDMYMVAGVIGVQSGTLTGGISSFSVTCKDMWDTGIERTLQLLINGQVVDTYKHNGSGNYIYNVDSINIAGNFTIEIKNASSTGAGNKSIALDNITWTSYNGTSTAAHTNIELVKTKIYPNPFSSEITIDSNRQLKQVDILDIAGRIVFSKTVSLQNLLVLNPSYNIVPNGIYLLRLLSKSDVKTYKLIRE